jgi:hypothetical protein
MLKPDPYTYISKDNEEYPSSAESSPIEHKRVVGGCSFNSLVDHPYKEAFARFGIPAGLVVSKGGIRELNTISLTREMVRGGGSMYDVPPLVKDSIYDDLFDKVSPAKPPRRLTRKTRV